MHNALFICHNVQVSVVVVVYYIHKTKTKTQTERERDRERGKSYPDLQTTLFLFTTMFRWGQWHPWIKADDNLHNSTFNCTLLLCLLSLSLPGSSLLSGLFLGGGTKEGTKRQKRKKIDATLRWTNTRNVINKISRQCQLNLIF